MLEGHKGKNIWYRCGDVMSFLSCVAQNRTRTRWNPWKIWPTSISATSQ